MKDFFVSYNRHDKAWAEWIAWTLEEAGYTVVIEAWDFRAGGNFALDMQQAASQAKRTIAVLSANYLSGRFTHPEWAAAFAQDPTGEKHLLVPVRIGTCEPTGLLRSINYVDLMGLEEVEAKDGLLRSLAESRAKPTEPPHFPGSKTATSDRPKPVFPPSIPCNLPPVSAIFVGRDDDLERLHTQLQTGDTIAISAISGMGGIGKTELAAQYALQQRDMGTYPGGICWLKAREDLNPQIVLFARSHLGLTVPEDLELGAQVAYCWQHWRPGMTLLVFDDVQAYQDVIAVAIPQRSQFRVLLTTRLTLQSPVQNFKIKVLSEERAIELLKAIVPNGRIDEDLETAKKICEWLGYLPLGLELVGRYLVWDEDVTMAILWKRLQEKRTDAIALKQTYPGMTASDGVAAAFELSWQTLNEPAQQLAALLSLFAPAEIPWTLVEACLPEWDAEDLQLLRNHSLLNLHLLERTGQGMYQLHQLLRSFFAVKREQRADADAMKQAFCQVMVDVAQQIPYSPNLSLLEQITPTIPHIKEAATTFVAWLTDTALITPSNRISWFYQGQAAYAEAEEWCKQCRAITTQRLGADHPAVAVTLNNLALLYRVQGRYGEAEPLYLRALAISKQYLGAEHPDIATTLNNLALLYEAQGRYGEAEPMYLRALEISEQHLGSEHPDVATTLNNLAKLYFLQGRYGEAEPLFLRALAIGEQQLGADHLFVATSLNNLAEIYRLQGRYTEAGALRLRCLEIEKQTLGENHPRFAASLNNLAGLYKDQGRYAEAELMYLRALEINERRLGADHPDLATTLNNLAGLYRAQGHYAEAEPLYLRALASSEQHLGTDHPFVATSLNNLALLYRLQGRYTEAEPLCLRALAIGEQQLGVDHPTVATMLNTLAGLYADQGRYAEAEPMFQRALAISKQQLGADHPDVAIRLNNLAELYQAQERYAEAERCYLQSLPILFAKLGEDHPNTQTGSQNFLGFLQMVVQAQQLDELSDDPVTQDLLRQIQKGDGV